jgi:hypothetical protein
MKSGGLLAACQRERHQREKYVKETFYQKEQEEDGKVGKGD